MKTNGFTLVEALVSIVVLCMIVLIALPMHAVRVKKTEQINVKAQLVTIKESEVRYKNENGVFTADTTKLANWKNNTRRYRFHVAYADTSRFTAQAQGDMDNDKVYDDDVWAIDQSGTLRQIK
jgi:prepilin-type N-terminal cleavage/methylation domain-containing protein